MRIGGSTSFDGGYDEGVLPHTPFFTLSKLNKILDKNSKGEKRV